MRPRAGWWSARIQTARTEYGGVAAQIRGSAPEIATKSRRERRVRGTAAKSPVVNRETVQEGGEVMFRRRADSEVGLTRKEDRLDASSTTPVREESSSLDPVGAECKSKSSG